MIDMMKTVPFDSAGKTELLENLFGHVSASILTMKNCIRELCKPSFCCIHDADPELNPTAPSCSNDENCAQYAYCYIIWYKFHDTLGPAPYLNVEQVDDFFDVSNSEVRGNLDDDIDDFYLQLYFHHFDTDSEVFDEAETDRLSEIDLFDLFSETSLWG